MGRDNMAYVKNRTIAGRDYRIEVNQNTGEFAVMLDGEELKAPTLPEVEAMLETAAKKPRPKPIEVSLLGLCYNPHGYHGQHFIDADAVIDVELRGRNTRTHALLLTVAGAKFQDSSYGSKTASRLTRRLTDAEKQMYLRRRAAVKEANDRLAEFEKSVGMGDVDALLAAGVQK